MNAQTSGYWFGKNVLITGVNGFIGGNLAKKLVDSGANVLGLMRNAKRDTQLFYEQLDKKITLIDGNITDKDQIAGVISEERVHSVFHLAAQVEIGVGLTNPFLTFETNVRGTYSLLEAIRQSRYPIESIVVASTDKSYGSYPMDKMPYKEDYPLQAVYPYDVSKACADMIARCYASDVHKLPIVVTRFCNIFGPGQLNFSAVIPDAIRACLGYGVFVPRGNGEQVRDFIFIEDVVDLYLRIGEILGTNPQTICGQIFNAGTNAPKKIRDVLEAVYMLTGRQRAFEDVLRDMKGKATTGEIDYQFMDYEKANRYTGWAPKHTFNEGLAKTIEWFRGYLSYKYES